MVKGFGLLICAVFAAVPALTAGPDEAPAIASALVDYATSRITIAGSHFSPAGIAPTVAFDQAPLSLVAFTDQSASVTLPDGWASGSYVLAVTNSNHQTAVYHLTLDSAPPPIDKFRYHAEALYNPWSVAGTFAYAGLLQELKAPKEWGEGAAAYGRRVASTEGAAVIHSILAFGLDAGLHQDPRYFRAGRGGLFHRMAHAARGTFMTRTDSGSETVSTWRLGSAYGAAFLSNTWYPNRLDTAWLGFVQGSVRIGFDLVSNLSSEFWPDLKKAFRHHHD